MSQRAELACDEHNSCGFGFRPEPRLAGQLLAFLSLLTLKPLESTAGLNASSANWPSDWPTHLHTTEMSLTRAPPVPPSSRVT